MNQKTRHTHSYTAIFALGLLSASVYNDDAAAKSNNQTTIKLSAHVGTDSNPHRFSDTLNTQSAQYIEAKLKGRYELSDHFYLMSKLDTRQYGGDAKDASASKYILGAGYKQKLKFGSDKIKLKSRLQFGRRDKTYVSRTTGNIAQWSNESIGDRYDYTFYGLDSDLGWAPNKANSFTVNLDYSGRDYEDFNISTLSNLDYSAYTLGLNWKHKFDRRQSLKVKVAHRYRNYVDYRAHDADGIDIPNSELNYHTWIARFSYAFKATDVAKFTFMTQFDQRRDNKFGYDNTDKLFGRFHLSYELDQQSDLEASVSYSQYDYPNRAQVSNSQDEELSEEKGFRYKLKYARDLRNIEGLTISTSLRYDDIRSDLPIYQYDRSQLSIGAKYTF
jgi:hypothetical protein